MPIGAGSETEYGLECGSIRYWDITPFILSFHTIWVISPPNIRLIRTIRVKVTIGKREVILMNSGYTIVKMQLSHIMPVCEYLKNWSNKGLTNSSSTM